MRVSTVGLGTVGMALSQRLLRAGYEVAGWHQDLRRVHAFADMGGTPVAGVAELGPLPTSASGHCPVLRQSEPQPTRCSDPTGFPPS